MLRVQKNTPQSEPVGKLLCLLCRDSTSEAVTNINLASRSHFTRVRFLRLVPTTALAVQRASLNGNF
jgi:hypothetical protein